MRISSEALTGLVRTLEHEILAGRRFAPIEVGRAIPCQPEAVEETGRKISSTQNAPETQPIAINNQQSTIGDCPSCPCKGALPPITGVGNENSPDYFFVCEYPASGADACGGVMAKADFELLENMLKAMGTDSASVYITAAIKCRPPNKTAADEAASCVKLLEEQIEQIKPKCIIALGDYALRMLTGQPSFTIRNEHGKLRKYKNIPFVPTFNPAYLNKFPAVKKDAWKDLKMAMTQIGK